jgi:steroid delta-isomerase-like uncharacterized protein
MTSDQNKNLIQQLFGEAMNGRNLALVDNLIAPGFINHGIPDAKPGPEGFKAVIQQFLDAFPDMGINVEQIIAEGDVVATRGYWTGTNKGSFMGLPPTGKQVRVEYSDFWKIKDDKCIENWVQMDIAGLMQQFSGMSATSA